MRLREFVKRYERHGPCEWVYKTWLTNFRRRYGLIEAHSRLMKLTSESDPDIVVGALKAVTDLLVTYHGRGKENEAWYLIRSTIDLILRLCEHQHPEVRGAAIITLGHFVSFYIDMLNLGQLKQERFAFVFMRRLLHKALGKWILDKNEKVRMAASFLLWVLGYWRPWLVIQRCLKYLHSSDYQGDAGFDVIGAIGMVFESWQIYNPNEATPELGHRIVAELLDIAANCDNYLLCFRVCGALLELLPKEEAIQWLLRLRKHSNPLLRRLSQERLCWVSKGLCT